MNRYQYILKSIICVNNYFRCPRCPYSSARHVNKSLDQSSFSSSPLGTFKLPLIQNEPLKQFEPNSPERVHLSKTLEDMIKNVHEVPIIINGQKVKSKSTAKQLVCSNHHRTLCEYDEADAQIIEKAIQGALKAKIAWENTDLSERCSVFLKAAEILTNKNRYKIMAATMLGQGKTIWQAEIDAVAELADFWRFNCQFAQEIYAHQPNFHAPGTWNKIEYRALEGFIFAISPFNFTAIGGNLPSAPALMGNVVLWKPSQSAILSNYIVYETLMEAGLPPGVIQFVPGKAAQISSHILKHPDFAGLHFTGSTEVFQHLWKQIANNIDIYKSYPRIVGETGGKNMHFAHKSADVKNLVHQTIRAAFEYQGQKCSACSRAYIPDNIWPEMKRVLLEQMKTIKIGPVEDFKTFFSAVINRNAFDKCVSYIEWAKSSSDAEILFGGIYDDSQGFFIHPTILLAKDPHIKTMKEEIFGPILTIYVYPAEEYEKYLSVAAETSCYGLTSAIFATDRDAIIKGTNMLRHAAGNMYINDKCTGAVVGQQPFGGSRLSGTNDKAGSSLNLYRWISPRTIKESFISLNHWSYPSCQ